MKNKEKFIINDVVIFDFQEKTLESVVHAGQTATISLPASRCLHMLLLNPGEVIKQKEFFTQVWGENGQYVTNNTLYQNISIIRRAMKSVGLTDEIVITVPKEGIKLVAEVQRIHSNENVLTNVTEDSQVAGNESDSFIVEPPADMTDSQELPATPLGQAENAEKEALEPDAILYESVEVSHPSGKEGDLFSTNWKIIYIALITCSILVTSGLYLFENPKNKDFFSAYMKIGEVNNCSVYAEKNNIYRRQDGYLSFFREMKISCQLKQAAYVTANPSNTKLTVIICNGNGNDNKNGSNTSTCFSKYYSGLKDEN
ncbi:hypothetical protein FCL49_09390 [Serratia proteamaculans]|uniref:winged helix-turn-helix domain-containing protein n=1 Tax=Serratia proteamaculans TaxID=28151 RepID=UPI001576110B|nr:winged helix-turn-helix domain-containing protein [Serratia proteamaculans]NTX77448.1 hypothetical protein [Serratia proteamaculans]NTZ28309.1 hypothetical protein [Serratia proteamaculans]